MDVAARNALVLQWQPLACKIALRMYRKSYGVRKIGDTDDVISVAYLALIRAAELYDPNRGQATFSTYASRAVITEVTNAARDAGLIRVPRYLQVEYYSGRAADRPQLQSMAQVALKFERDWQAEVLERQSQWDQEELDWLHRHLKALTPEDQNLLDQLFGLKGAEVSRGEIAAKMGVARQSVQNHRRRILNRLREQMQRELEGCR